MAICLPTMIAIRWTEPFCRSRRPWCCGVLFGYFGTSGILPCAVLSQSFPPQLSGMVNMALNLLVFVFVTAFTAQWGIESIIEL